MSISGVRPSPVFQAVRPQAVRPVVARFGHTTEDGGNDHHHFHVTNTQHRVIQGIASTFFLIGSALWGDNSWQHVHDLFSEEMMAPAFTGMGSLVLLINSIIPVENWRSPRPTSRQRGRHAVQRPRNKPPKS